MTVDIFRQINQLYRREEIEGGEINSFVLHRFMASDPTYAASAKQIGNAVHDDSLTTGIWSVALPKLRQAPFFKYPAPKRPAAAEELSKKIMDVENLNQADADEVVMMLEALGVLEVARAHYGVEEEKKP